jgi:hypothetical protein
MSIERRLKTLEKLGDENFFLFDVEGKVLWAWCGSALNAYMALMRALEDPEIIVILRRAHHASQNFAALWQIPKALIEPKDALLIQSQSCVPSEAAKTEDI